ncbi:glycosyltransferase [Microbacteriaceae bacterium VKM Ac-2854]|nr:glycosyltransferase [Microbacteriaceae bacterium VKM Ac-2854]
MTIPMLPPITTALSGTPSARVQSVPAAHPYVRSIGADPRVFLLPDPPVPGAPAEQWWPPQALRADWIRRHRDDADLLHIHFGTESYPPAELRAAVAAARANGWPVVVTVHDLEHPQLSEQAAYRAQLDVLIPAADALITLTEGAAAEIRARWGRAAQVLPHPRLLTTDVVDPALNPTAVIGVALKDLRPNIDAVVAVHAALDAAAELSAAGVPTRAQIRMHRQVRDPERRDAIRRLLAGAGSTAELIEHDRLDDAALADALNALDVAVLPYGYGSHSGWLELCWDLGVPVAVPRRGFYAQQHSDDTVAEFEDGTLADAVGRLLRGPRAGSVQRTLLRAARHGERLATDTITAERHAELYLRLLAERAGA